MGIPAFGFCSAKNAFAIAVRHVMRMRESLVGGWATVAFAQHKFKWYETSSLLENLHNTTDARMLRKLGYSRFIRKAGQKDVWPRYVRVTNHMLYDVPSLSVVIDRTLTSSILS